MPKQGSTSKRGYGTNHQKIRKSLEPLVASGQATCWRCQQPIHPTQQWDLGHDDLDKTKYQGPEHALKKDCTAGGNRASARRQRKPHGDTSRAW